MPYMRISQIQTANIHTSLAAVNLLKLILSGAIHLIGNLPLDAEIIKRAQLKKERIQLAKQ